jgi:hypothetical protein
MSTRRKVVRLSVVRNERKAAEVKHMRRDMHTAVRSTCRALGDDLSGYALVSWTRGGEVHTNINEGYGPFGWGSLPGQCHDAINRHIAIVIANPDATIPHDEPEGA